MKFNFLIAGVQKAATTAVHHFLRHHPQIFMPSIKELHFFDRENGIDWSNPDYSEYNRHLNNPGIATAYGEATPIYTFWPHSIERIHRYNTDMRIIVILRDPIERAYSHWKMETTRGAEQLNFSNAIRGGRSRVRTIDAISNGDYATFSYVERGIYAPQVKHLINAFPRQQICFATVDELQRDHHQFLDDVYAFLGVEKPHNYPKYEEVRTITSKGTFAPLDAQDQKYLHSIFESDIAETSELTGLDLYWWKRTA